MSAATATLIEMGYDVRRYRHQDVHRLSTWARKSVEKYAGRALLVCTKGTPHALVIKDGRVYDTFTPHGERVSVHPFAKDIVNWCALIERKK